MNTGFLGYWNGNGSLTTRRRTLRGPSENCYESGAGPSENCYSSGAGPPSSGAGPSNNFYENGGCRVTTFAMEDADRHLARRKRQLRQQLEMLKLQQQYLGGNVTDRSTIPEHGGGDQPIQNDRHAYVEHEWGAEDQKKVGTPTRGEQKI